VQPVDRMDVRLVPAALLAWGTVLLGLLGGWHLAAAVVGGALAGLPLVLRLDNRAVAAGLFVCLVMASGFALATALRAHAVATHPLHAAVRDGAAVSMRVQLTDDPKLLHSAIPGAPQQVLVRADLRAADGYRSVHGAVVLLAPAKDWASLLPSQQVALFGRLGPPQRADLTVAAVQVRGPPTLIGESSWRAACGGSAAHEAASGLIPGAGR